MTIDLFEVIATRNATMAPKLWEIFDRFFHTDNILAFVKDKAVNLQSCVTTFTFVVSCKILNMLEPFHGSYFGLVLFKVYRYVIKDKKMAQGLAIAFINSAKIDIQKCIT